MPEPRLETENPVVQQATQIDPKVAFVTTLVKQPPIGPDGKPIFPKPQPAPSGT